MDRQSRSKALCFLIVLFALPGLTKLSTAQADERPNIILVMADDQGWGDMAYNGHAEIKTPNFDQMASQNLQMTRFYAAAPVCSPTRASVLTGRHPNRMGVFKWGYPMRPQEKTIAEIFKSAGYATAHFGKWHLGSVRNNSPAHPGANGFDHWVSAPNFFENDPILCQQGRAVQFSGESSEVTVDLAIDWIKPQVAKKKPFLAVVWFGSPHAPHVASDKTKQIYEGKGRKKQNFYGEVTGMDDALGKLQKSLDQMGIRDNTVLWYISDNGALPNIGSSGGRRGHKGKIYEGGLMVPSIFQWPAKFKAHQKIDCRGNSCDILPTLLAITDIKTDNPLPLDGENLLPVFLGQQTSRKSPMGFWDYAVGGKSVPSNKLMQALLQAQEQGGDLSANEVSLRAARLPDQKFSKASFPGHSAWIDGSWKLHRIEKKEGSVVFELYDLESDPNESKNLLIDHPQRVQNMTAALNQWLESVVDSFNGNDYQKK